MPSFKTAFDHITQRQFAAAVREGREAAAALGPRWEARHNLAGVLIDAGAQGRRRPWVVEGIGLLNAVLTEVPAEASGGVHYNLGNGYLAATELRKGRSLSTRNAQSLALAVNALAQAAELKPDLHEARINLASALLQQGRSIEAIDLLTMVVAVAPSHPMPRLKRAIALEHVHGWMHPRGGVLDSALRDALAAQERAGAFPEYARGCESAVTRLRGRVKQARPHGEAVEAPGPLSWMWEAGLALNPCVRCCETSPTAFDVLVLDGLLDHRGRRPSADEVAEIVSAWHRTFSAARWTVMGAMEVEHPLPSDHVVALRGGGKTPDLRTGLLLQAAVGFHAVFDQIAFGLNAYLHLGHSPKNVTFNTVWYRRGKRPAQKGVLAPSELHTSLRGKALPPLSALYWLSRSLQDDGGLYHRLRDLRNQAEHHVTVAANTVTSRYFTVVDGERLAADVLALGRLAKAAMWYAGAIIFAHEKARARRAARRGAVIVSGTRNVQRA
jgi:hypothetical protein